MKTAAKFKPGDKVRVKPSHGSEKFRGDTGKIDKLVPIGKYYVELKKNGHSLVDGDDLELVVSKSAAQVKFDKSKVKRWMQSNLKDHIDRKTDEVNATGLAEAAADQFDLYEDRQDYTIPDEVFDLAAKVSETYERNRKSASLNAIKVVGYEQKSDILVERAPNGEVRSIKPSGSMRSALTLGLPDGTSEEVTVSNSFFEKWAESHENTPLAQRVASRFSTAQDNSWGMGNYSFPPGLANLGRYCDALRPANVEHKVFPNEGIHMLTAKVNAKLSIMAADMKSLLRLGLVRIQSNEPGTMAFYFEGYPVIPAE